MNREHAEFGSSASWAEHLQTEVLPWAQTGIELPDTLLEIGPGYGPATDMLRRQVSG